MLRLLRFSALLPLLLLTLPGLAAEKPRTIVLGFDGADGDLTERWMDEGKLPNLARLRSEGTFSPLQPTIPSQTPVSWSTFATGLDPGRHGIIDFLERDAKTYRPRLALIDESTRDFLFGANNRWAFGALTFLILTALGTWLCRRRARRVLLGVLVALVAAGAGTGTFYAADLWLPDKIPVVKNPQQGETFWNMLGDAGVRVRVLRLPQTFPAEAFADGKLLTGLGTPDLSLRIGKPFYLTSELFFQPEQGDFSIEVVELIDNRGRFQTEIKGPPDQLFSEPGKLKYIKTAITVDVAADRKSLTLEIGDQRLKLAPGQWSDWARFEFPYNPLIKLHGIGRFYLIGLEPEIRIYLSPIQFDPENLPPDFGLSTPNDFAAKLIGTHGLYKTIGWAIDTWSIEAGTMSEELFLEDVEMTITRDELMLADQLAEKADWDVLVHYFEFTDKVQHLMFRLFDPLHPRYDAALAARFGNSILESYQRMDKIVGSVMAQAPAGTKIFVLSDHGFSTWRHSMNYNTWLAKEGYMTLIGQDNERKNLEDLFDQGDFFVNVDWKKTKAYALGFGSIFLNLEGREGQGIVTAAEYEPLRQELRAKLTSFVDDQTGEKPVAHVFLREEAWKSFDPLIAPDLIAANADGYRAGWQDTLGGIASQVVEPNTKRWSGDHCSLYPPLVEGILFSNQKLQGERPYMGDLAPTLLQIYGVSTKVNFDGKSLLPQ